MMNEGWRDLRTDGPDGIDPETVILFWHVYQGVMADKAGNRKRNSFFCYWQPIHNDEWTAAAKRLPGRQDADTLNCVLSRDKFGQIAMTGWRRFQEDRTLTEWQRPPAPPENFRDLRNKNWED